MSAPTRTTWREQHDETPTRSMPDNYLFAGDGGINGQHGPLNSYNLLEAAERSLCETIDAEGIEACPAALRAALLTLNQLEQIATGGLRVACFIDNLEEVFARETKETHRLLRELTAAVRALARA